MSRVLLVEDDVDLSGLVARQLRRAGHDVMVTGSGLAAWSEAVIGHADLVVLDLGLPDLDGIEVCRRLRRDNPGLPVLILTARTGEADVVAGLDAGADDYLTKPFRTSELLARIRTIIRRTSPEVLLAPPLRIEVRARRAFIGDLELVLRPKEYDLLTLLVRHNGEVITREALMDQVWDEHWGRSTKTLDVHTTWLRAKLGEAGGDPGWITTVRGVGYRFGTD